MTVNCSCRSHNGFLTAKGLAEARERSGLVGVDRQHELLYLDRGCSVSGLVEVEEDHVWDEEILDEQFRRWIFGSSEGSCGGSS